MIWQEMFGNGSQIGTLMIIIRNRPIGIQSAQAAATVGLFAVAHGIQLSRRSAPRIDSGRSLVGMTSMDFAAQRANMISSTSVYFNQPT